MEGRERCERRFVLKKYCVAVLVVTDAHTHTHIAQTHKQTYTFLTSHLHITHTQHTKHKHTTHKTQTHKTYGRILLLVRVTSRGGCFWRHGVIVLHKGLAPMVPIVVVVAMIYGVVVCVITLSSVTLDT